MSRLNAFFPGACLTICQLVLTPFAFAAEKSTLSSCLGINHPGVILDNCLNRQLLTQIHLGDLTRDVLENKLDIELSQYRFGTNRLLEQTFERICAQDAVLGTLTRDERILALKSIVNEYSVPRDLAILSYMGWLKYKKSLQDRGLNPSSQPESFSKLAQSAGANGLQHQTNREDLWTILKSKKLSPSRFGQQNILFMEIFFAEPRFGRSYDYLITTGTESLDQVPWSHASIEWRTGEASRLSSATRDQYFDFLLFEPRFRSKNEVIFEREISLQKTDFRILVKTENQREQLIGDLKGSKISPPRGRDWESVVGVALIPAKNFCFDQLLEPVRE